MKALPLVLALFSGTCLANTVWFVVVGNQKDPAADTVIVDPVPVEISAEGARVMTIRVNRATERKNWEGVPYRSYEARVRFNCSAMTAQYVSGTFYIRPLWGGEPQKVTDYSRGPVRQMLFLDMSPNPTARIVRAACAA